MGSFASAFGGLLDIKHALAQPRLVEFVTVAGLILATAGSVTYVGLAGFNPDDPGIHDNREYAALYEGHGADVKKPFHWRVVIPALARMLPGGFEVSFGIVNILALTVAGVGLYYLLRHWRASQNLSLIGVALYFLSHTVLRFGGIPLVESAAQAILILAMLAAEKRQRFAFATLVILGMFVKETTSIVLLYPLLMSKPLRDRLTLSALALPGIAAYAIVRLVIDPVNFGFEYSATAWITNIGSLIMPVGLGSWPGIVLSFGFLWVFVALGIRRGGLVPRRYALFIAACFAAPIILTTDYERVIFLSFPVALALALPSMERALSLSRRSGRRAALGAEIPQSSLTS
ncbi:hypothetical protein GCM10023346_17030 [Arthrobacter gyeryongensis]|uniref:Glycosyltransferase RgtA/B/C/D-like domain-containing protein n=1 Tax=Arthrobacter gyeryongensis TaxID=1650592 RepID=A0ABP9S9L5_9MICC